MERSADANRFSNAGNTARTYEIGVSERVIAPDVDYNRDGERTAFQATAIENRVSASHGTIVMSRALIILLTAALICGGTMLFTLLNRNAQLRRQHSFESEISRYSQQNVVYRQQLEAGCKFENISYLAEQTYGMVPKTGDEAVYVTVPATRAN